MHVAIIGPSCNTWSLNYISLIKVYPHLAPRGGSDCQSNYIYM